MIQPNGSQRGSFACGRRSWSWCSFLKWNPVKSKSDLHFIRLSVTQEKADYNNGSNCSFFHGTLFENQISSFSDCQSPLLSLRYGILQQKRIDLDVALWNWNIMRMCYSDSKVGLSIGISSIAFGLLNRNRIDLFIALFDGTPMH